MEAWFDGGSQFQIPLWRLVFQEGVGFQPLSACSRELPETKPSTLPGIKTRETENNITPLESKLLLMLTLVLLCVCVGVHEVMINNWWYFTQTVFCKLEAHCRQDTAFCNFQWVLNYSATAGLMMSLMEGKVILLMCHVELWTLCLLSSD